MRTIEEDGVSVTIAKANYEMALLRTHLLREAEKELRETTFDDEHAWARWITYPNCIACAVKAEGMPWPLSFDDFCKNSETFNIAWEQAVYEVNPHWKPDLGAAAKAVSEEAQEKKD
jgi:hypothetical protein